MLNNQRGSVLIYVVLLVFSLAALVFVSASVIVRTVTETGTRGEALRAFYGAESAMEFALAHADRSQRDGATLAETLQKLTSASPLLLNDGTTLGAIASSTSRSVESQTIPMLHEGADVTQIEVIDPDDPFAMRGQPLQSLSVHWEEMASCPHGTSQLEILFVQIAQENYRQDTTMIEQRFLPCTTGATSPRVQCSGVINTPTQQETEGNFVLRVKSSSCDVASVTVQFFDAPAAAGDVVPLLSRLRIVTQGMDQRATKEMTAERKWLPSASGFVDYVVFAVEHVKK